MRLRSRKTEVERSCASKRMKMMCAGVNMSDMVMILFLRGQHKPGNLESCKWSWIVRALRQHKENEQQRILSDRMSTQFVESVPGQTCPCQVEGQTFPSHLKQNKGTGNSIRSLCSRTRWEPQIQIPTRSVHQTFQANGHENSSRCACHISILSRLAVTRAWIFALNKLTTEGTGTYSHFGPRPLRTSWLTCCCIAVIACGIGLFHMARASSRLTSVQINTTKQFWLWGLAACLPPRWALTYA